VTEEVVRQMYDAIAVADMQTFIGLLHPDVEWTVPGHHVLAGTTTGVPELLAHLAEVVQRTGGQVQIAVEEITAGERFTTAIVNVQMTVDGQTVDDRQVHVFEVRDNRIVSVREYHSDQRAFDLLFGD